MAIMPRKPVTARAVEPNAGRRKQYAQKIKDLLNNFSEDILNEIYDYLLEQMGMEAIFSKHNKLLVEDSAQKLQPDPQAKTSSKYMGLRIRQQAKRYAQDISLSNPRTQKEKEALELLQKRIDKSIKRNPTLFRKNMDEFIASNMDRWLDKIETVSTDVVKWYTKNCAFDVTRSQRKALASAGIDDSVFKQRWKIPQVNQYISPNARVAVEQMTTENVGLIQHIAGTDLARIKNTVMDTMSGKADFSKLEKVLEHTSGFDEARAQRVALDQSLKISQTVQRENCKSLGMTKAVWIHVPGQYSSRETHIEFDGQEFDIDEGLYDSEVGYEVVPGELPYCRCIYRSIIPDEWLS